MGKDGTELSSTVCFFPGGIQAPQEGWREVQNREVIMIPVQQCILEWGGGLPEDFKVTALLDDIQ